MSESSYEAIVLYDYQAVEEGELTVVKGQVVTVKEKNESGWCLVVSNDQNGWIPLDYIQKTDSAIALPDLSQMNLQPPTENVCVKCKQPVRERYVVAKERLYHVDHFTCVTCNKSLAGVAYIERDGDIYCENDYHEKYSPPCGYCQDKIRGKFVTALGQTWHPEHFVCAECSQPFSESKFYKHDDKPYCEEHFNKLFGMTCSKCNQLIQDQVYEALGKKFHLTCFVCEVEAHPIGQGAPFHVYEEKVYCEHHFEDLFLQKCSVCNKSISAEYVSVMNKVYHASCWQCCNCQEQLAPTNVEFYKGEFFCKPCHAQVIKGVSIDIVEQGRKSVANAPTHPPPHVPTDTPAVTPVETVAATTVSAAATQPIVDVAPATTAPATTATTEPAAVTETKEMGESYYPYNVLKALDTLPSQVDRSKREQYLAPDMFEKLFKMSKDKFNSLQDWKKKQLKQSTGLW